MIIECFGGRVPERFEELLELPGVARKTANVVMGNAFGVASGVVVDTHVSRLSQRLGLTEHENPEKIERDLVELVPKKDWVDFSHLMIYHGRNVCKARLPQCSECVVERLCPSSLLKAEGVRRTIAEATADPDPEARIGAIRLALDTPGLVADRTLRRALDDETPAHVDCGARDRIAGTDLDRHRLTGQQ